VIGILIALSINNWNNYKLERNSDIQLLNSLIADLELKNNEVVSDLNYGQSIIRKTQDIIDGWKNENKIDTLNLKYSISKLGEDEWFFNEKSPVLDGLANSDLWKRMPDSLIRQLDKVYRSDLAYVKSSFSKSAEYATHSKLNFLLPNGLTITSKSTADIYSIISKKDEEFISNLEVLRGGVFRLNNLFARTSNSIKKLIENLKIYQSELKK
tara:strand:- start:907 stop:1542 length:636 start_codon:yes stop_codon:yes gene_type:complete